MATITKLTATIGSGQPLSNVVDLGGRFLVGIIMPTGWTTAHVSVLVSLDSTNFYDLFSFQSGVSTSPAEFAFNVRPNAIVAVNPDAMLMARYIRLRSGTRDAPVVQTEARVFGVITVNAVTVQALPAEMRNETDSDESV
jgi:hypothetical protein